MTTDERAQRIEEALAQDRPWSVIEVLDKLAEAAGILLHGKDYDGHGWELIDAARSHAREHATNLRAALALEPAPPPAPSEECP